MHILWSNAQTVEKQKHLRILERFGVENHAAATVAVVRASPDEVGFLAKSPIRESPCTRHFIIHGAGEANRILEVNQSS
jgi:hypothetical protein